MARPARTLRSRRMVIRIRQGKGKKDRYARLGDEKIQTTVLYTHISLEEQRTAPSLLEFLQGECHGDDPV